MYDVEKQDDGFYMTSIPLKIKVEMSLFANWLLIHFKKTIF